MNLKKTNVARLLDREKIKYELVPYKVNPDDLSATKVAASLGEDIAQVFKTIVMEGDHIKYFICVVPGNKEIDLKAAAKISGNKKCETLPLKQLQPLTGYIRGGCSPLGMKKIFPTFIDSSAQSEAYIYVSAGQRGLQIKLSPQDLAKQTNAAFASLTKED